MTRPRRSMCPIAFALDLLGDRWSLLVLRDMLLGGARHFHEFRDAGEGIATNILSDRLTRLEEAGLVVRTPDPEDGRRAIYRPTPRALDLVPLLLELVVWGGRHDPDTPVGQDFLDRWATNRDAVLREFAGRADPGSGEDTGP